MWLDLAQMGILLREDLNWTFLSSSASRHWNCVHCIGLSDALWEQALMFMENTSKNANIVLICSAKKIVSWHTWEERIKCSRCSYSACIQHVLWCTRFVHQTWGCSFYVAWFSIGHNGVQCALDVPHQMCLVQHRMVQQNMT